MAIAGFFYTRGSLNLKQFIHPRGKYLIYNEKNAKNKSCYSKKKMLPPFTCYSNIDGIRLLEKS